MRNIYIFAMSKTTKKLKKKITIAIDGFSSCGKSTLAKALAKKLHYIYADSGAMYRAVTLFFLQNRIDIYDKIQVIAALSDVHIHFENDTAGQRHTFLNRKDVEDEIRKMYISEFVSKVAAIPEVRRAMVKQQQEMGKRKGIVMDGRDIGTVVFKDAELKLFLTADPDIRTQRRVSELARKGEITSAEAVKRNLMERDHIDSTREDSPLRKAADAIEVDNSTMTEVEQVEIVLTMVKRQLELLGDA
jgi:cytidylate kinase